VQRATQGTPNPELANLRPMRKDLTLRETVVVAPLIAALLVFGFYPKPLLDVINPAVAATLDHLNVKDPSPALATSSEAGK
jgi:NADH-quinone oxidoreductase subunit M